MEFESKARNLINLSGIISAAKVPPLIVFSKKSWLADPANCLLKVKKKFGSEDLFIVRSSCDGEDGLDQSGAGAFLSLANVRFHQLSESVDQVFYSYQSSDLSNEVFVQLMLTDVSFSGVAFSHDPSTLAPDKVISWAEGEDTSIVTGGKGGNRFQIASGFKLAAEDKFYSVIRMLEELLLTYHNRPIDCEFAVTGTNETQVLWLLQVRPLVLSAKPVSDAEHSARLKLAEEKIKMGMCEHPLLLGKKTYYGVMPDWNPAEIVGLRPRPLALSLYKELITDSIWAYQRHNYGYRNLRSFPLMQTFHGLPYVDVRVSFNSFIPADLDEDLGGRLVDYYLEKLADQPNYHDKVEFKIVWSCFTFDLDSQLKEISSKRFSSKDKNLLRDSLLKITNSVISPPNGLWHRDVRKLEILRDRYELIVSSNLGVLEKIYWLIEDAKRYGALPFAGLARAGFMAIQMLESLVTIGIFSREEYDLFVAGVSTVAKKFREDLQSLNTEKFLKIYGHLRPGTYDILTPRYDEEPGYYFRSNASHAQIISSSEFVPRDEQLTKLEALLKANMLNIGAQEFLDFIRSAIEKRELAKFEFTRNLSDSLSLISELGGKFGISKEDLSYCDFEIFKKLYSSSNLIPKELNESARQGKSQYAETLKLSLPPLIMDPKQIYAFRWPDMAPNFITQKVVVGNVVSAENIAGVKNAIVCIPHADPGFDWIFSYPVAALITAWGGANSHMAIRAGELGIPAVIGAGEVLYELWGSSERLQIDCAGGRVEIVV